MTARQAALLATAKQQYETILTVILAGADIGAATVVRVDPTAILVEVPDA